jgi:hypothetical protein
MSPWLKRAAITATCTAPFALFACNEILNAGAFHLVGQGGTAGVGTAGGSVAAAGGGATTSVSTGGAGGHRPQCTTKSDCDAGVGCVTAACTGGTCTSVNADNGHPCVLPDGGGASCDGLGTCGGAGSVCDASSSCLSNVCRSDAGGSDGGACPASDCCAVPTCSDGVLNGDETDTDCGGKTCPGCSLGAGCRTASDCVANAGYHCASGVCCLVACDGPCEICALGTGACYYRDGGTDLAHACTCNGSPGCAHCFDGIKDADETAIDCGGAACRRCANGQGCKAGKQDCESCLCQGGICVADMCNSDAGVPVGCQSDVNCGGPCGATCGDMQACRSNNDCASYHCADGGCVGP